MKVKRNPFAATRSIDASCVMNACLASAPCIRPEPCFQSSYRIRRCTSPPQKPSLGTSSLLSGYAGSTKNPRTVSSD